jgi:hypothetical protein
MRRYLIVSAAIFVLILGAHVARVVAEGTRLLIEPDFVMASLAALGMAIWAIALLRRLPTEG